MQTGLAQTGTQTQGMKLSKIPACVAVFFVELYRKLLSPLLGVGKCRFLPTCSEYAVQAFEKYGLMLGFMLAVRRLLRCGPWSEGGYDPLPEREELNRIWFGRLFLLRKDR